MAGWVYILSNPAMPGLLKIGYTDRDPFARAKEIGQATGVPFDFVVEYQAYVSHPYELEQKTHQLLNNHRVNNNREFFRCSYEDAVEAIRTAINYLDSQLRDFVSGSESSYKIEKEILEEKLAEKREKQRRLKLWKESSIKASEEFLAKNIAELNALEKKDIKYIEEKFIKPPFLRNLAFAIIAIPVPYIAWGALFMVPLFLGEQIGLITIPIYYFILWRIYVFLSCKIPNLIHSFLYKEKIDKLNRVNILYENKRKTLYQEYNATINQINEKTQ